MKFKEPFLFYLDFRIPAQLYETDFGIPLLRKKKIKACEGPQKIVSSHLVSCHFSSSVSVIKNIDVVSRQVYCKQYLLCGFKKNNETFIKIIIILNILVLACHVRKTKWTGKFFKRNSR